jgi:putative endonuclease
MSELEKSKSLNERSWVLYIIKTQRDTFYTGITNDLENRWQTHLEGKGAKYLRSNKPEAIVFIEQQKNRSEATKREMEIKKMKRKDKLLLIASYTGQ